MSDWDDLKERYLRDTPERRLGALAANMARVSSFSDREEHAGAVEHMLEESERLIEWTAPEVTPERGESLVDLQIGIARWLRTWPFPWRDPSRRQSLAAEARAWSDRLLEMSGLLGR
ncbi:MAG: hypothetical protein HYY93_06605 [Planctomycetes bacterium]|nr:hypothetical protein [Planctomycetota bacterium]